MKRLLFIILTIEMLFAINAQELTSGEAINSQIEQRGKHYYSIIVPSNKSIRVSLTDLDEDAHLYIKRGDSVAIRLTDCYSNNLRNQNEECILNNEDKESKYSILVYGMENSSYKIEANIEKLEYIPSLVLGKTVSGEIKKGEFKPYKIKVKKGDVLKTTLFSLTNDADLRVKIGRKAGPHIFDCKSINGGTKSEYCITNVKEDTTLYIQIDGYKSAKYKLNILKKTENTPITRGELDKMIANNEDVTNVNVSQIQNMSNLLSKNSEFNQDISNWDVSSVTNMANMFRSATSFNQPIGKWNVSSVTNMDSMFHSNPSFNQSISEWNVSAVTNMSRMFLFASEFNQPIDNWNVSAVTEMVVMFHGATNFNQPIGSWNVSAVEEMTGMFESAINFNQPIGNWDISSVFLIGTMFKDATKFNQPLENWNMSKVTHSYSMFKGATNFNQPLNKWNVSKVGRMDSMFEDAHSFNQPLNSWNVGSVYSMFHMFDNSGQQVLPYWYPKPLR